MDAVVTDTVSITGLPGTGKTVKGQVIVDYVTDNGGRQTIHIYPVNETNDFNLTVEYPPVSQWPVLSNGTREIHVDIQLEIWQNGVMIGTLGAGVDWDVYCLGTPPTVTPTVTPTPPPTGGQGCTPGYWRQTQHFDSYPAPYTPNTYFDAVFGVGPHITLAEAAALKGNTDGEALVRHATAALLNAASNDVSYLYSVEQVIQMVKDAYASGNYNMTKDLFAAQNEMGCPLN